MIFVWSGLGFLVVPIVAITAMVVTMLLEGLLGAIGHSEWVTTAIALGIFSGAAANWFIGRKLNSKPPRELIDPKTQQTVLLYKRHKLFWVPMQYWSFPVAVIGVFVLLAQSTQAAPSAGAKALPSLQGLIECKGTAGGIPAYAARLEEGTLAGWTRSPELSAFLSDVWHMPQPITVAGFQVQDVRFGSHELGNYSVHAVTTSTDLDAVARQLGLRGVDGRGLAREAGKGAWVVASQLKGRVEVGCEYPNPKLAG
ncbi:hypothetical protein [Variovorax sp. LT1R16]|uniref:hypothetical protein n=1 Tax=Variovorax sp. LT1R16 TaxID=3443728 RepID=UPI003F450BD0